MIEIGMFLAEVVVGDKETIENVRCDKSGF